MRGIHVETADMLVRLNKRLTEVGHELWAANRQLIAVAGALVEHGEPLENKDQEINEYVVPASCYESLMVVVADLSAKFAEKENKKQASGLRCAGCGLVNGKTLCRECSALEMSKPLQPGGGKCQ